MPWDKKDYPDSMKNLDPDVREKAIEIANALLRDNYDEGRAIAIATAQARKAINGDDTDRPTYEVKARKDEWTLMKSGGERAIFVEETKEKLLEKAKPYVNDNNGVLEIYQENGSLDDTLYE
ncbi:hypothetical protein [Psychrobacillus sp. FJAT-21963]|uniref:hypothetical protein n=1 Tax=Psychrobacillus sp. FJAT-21963 TaxID=1712028 RepID=UPI0006FFB646|nr:hypothetical protein [Psychrobacillus sp. FJAT-21963]KQL37343.1 hypothetical protein AN959_04785 [Psychrobacillus sp. FJAT-21963]